MTPPDTRRVLVVTSPAAEEDSFLVALRDQCDLSIARTPDEAARLLHENRYDLVIASSEQLGPLARAAGAMDGRQLQSKLDAIDEAGRELVSINSDMLADMDVAGRLELLEEKIIGCCRDLLHFDHFAIVLVDKKSKRLESLVASGITEADPLGMVAETEGNGISGFVAATGQSYLCPDVSKDHRYLPGLEGARSCMAVPLTLHDRVVGVLNVESDRIAAFSAEDLQFAEIFGRYIGLALHILQLLVVERRATTGQIVADVDAESATPLNDIVADVAGIMDDFGEDNPKLRERLKQIIADVDRVKEAIHAVSHPAAVSGAVSDDRADESPLAGYHILVADDEDIIRETIAEVLAGAGALMSMAKDGSQAISLIRAQQFDLVLSDIKMPHRNGYEVFAAAREANPDCAVILLTGFGYDPDHAVVRAGREGLSGVLFKPFKVDQLLDQIQTALHAADK
jgi:CheY-like chemotaxis protein